MADFLGYPVPVAYASGLNVQDSWFTVLYESAVYAASADEVPFTTGETFDSTKWTLIEGVTYGSLVADIVTCTASLAAMRKLTSVLDNQVVNLLGYSTAGSQGGGEFRWDNGSSAEDDGGTIISVTGIDTGRFLRRIPLGCYTPEMFGAVGDGATDDYAAFQRMLDNVPAYGVIWLDPAHVYYNAFANNEGASRTWTRSKPVTMNCNGALMTRATPIKDVDGQSAILKLSGDGPFYINNPRMSGNNPLGYTWSTSTSQTTSGYQIANCQCIDYGIYALGASQVYIRDAEIYQCAFNIWAKSVLDFRLTGYLHHSGQVIPNVIDGGDKAYGAGIKMSDCTHFNIDVRGYRNTNATVEIEPNNIYGAVRQISTENVSNGLVIYDSSYIEFTSITNGTQIGCGTNITKGAATQVMKCITGKVISDGCYDSGFRLYASSSATADLEQIDINVMSRNSVLYGADIRNYGSALITNVDIKYDGKDNVGTNAGNDLWIHNDIRGRITGRSKGCYCGLIMTGANTQAAALQVSIDLTEVSSVPYSISSALYVDRVGMRTASEYSLVSSVQNVRMARAGAGMSTRAYTDVVFNGSHIYTLGLSSTGSFSGQIWYDSSNNNQVKFKST